MRPFLIILTILLATTSFAQRIKYKDLYPQIQSEQEEVSLMLIKEYLQFEPDHPNANFLLTRIYADRFLGADVLTEHERGVANAEQAKLRALKSKLLIDEREVRRNDEYYMDNDGMPLNWSEVDSLLQSTYDQSLVYIEKTPPIYQNFTRSVFFYDSTIKGYAEICGSYNSLDNLLMLYNGELENKLIQLKRNYDSTLFYFGKYKELIAEFPIGHDQKMTTVPIERFRLQGLVARIDFLNENVRIWDYGSWSDRIRNMVVSDISSLREKLSDNDKKLDELLNGQVPEGEYKSVVDKQLVYNLEKVDFQSLPVALLRYKDFLLGLKQSETKSSYYDTALNLEPSSKYIYYSDMINRLRMADTLLVEIADRNTEIKRDKHREFINDRYGGESGLNQFINTQKSSNSEKFGNYVRSLRNAIIDSQEEVSSDSGKYVTLRRQKYPGWVTGWPEEVEAGKFYTTIERFNPDGSHYLGGMYLKDKDPSNIVSYVIRENAGVVQWIREFDISIDSAGADANNILGAMELTKEGVLVLVNSSHLTSEMKMNSLFYIDEAGKDLLNNQLEDVADFPRMISYNEAANRILMIFRGEGRSMDLETSRPTRIVAINDIGDRIWDASHDFAGNFVDIVSLNEGYILVANMSTAGSSTNGLVLRLGPRGEELGRTTIDHPDSYYLAMVVKASDTNINLLGYLGDVKNYDGSKLQFGRDLVHVIVDASGKVIASGLD